MNEVSPRPPDGEPGRSPNAALRLLLPDSGTRKYRGVEVPQQTLHGTAIAQGRSDAVFVQAFASALQ